jgi:hypothetical protein
MIEMREAGGGRRICKATSFAETIARRLHNPQSAIRNRREDREP